MNKPHLKKWKALPKPLLISGLNPFAGSECLTLFFINLTCSHIPCPSGDLNKTGRECWSSPCLLPQHFGPAGDMPHILINHGVKFCTPAKPELSRKRDNFWCLAKWDLISKSKVTQPEIISSVLVGTILWYGHQIQGSSHEVEGPFKRQLLLCGSASVMQIKQRVVPLPTQTDNTIVGIWLGEREWYCPWGANQG